MTDLHAEFRRLARDRLDRLEALLTCVEQNTADDEVHRALRREIHTLKGEANMLGLRTTRRLAELLEEVIHGLAGVDPAAGALALAFEGLECVDDAVRGVGEDVEGRGAFEARVAALRSAPETRARSELDVTAAVPAAQNDEPVQPDDGAEPGADVRIASVRIEQLLRLVTGIESAQNERLASAARLVELRAILGRLRKSVAAAAASHPRDAASGEIASHLGAALGACEALDKALRSVAREAKNAALAEVASVEALSAAVRSVSVVPVADALSGYPRLFRRVAREAGKDVVLRIECEPIKVERRVMGSLAEPLVHLLTNAVDHGIEAPAERAAAGKPSTATVTLAARLVGARMQITVSDDGAGVAIDALRRRAVAQGVLDEAAAEALSEQHVLRLLTGAGFTTRTEVTKLSGRGIGLDVVRARVEALGGSLTLRTAAGEGTSFELEIPTSSTLARVVLVECDEAVFALPVHAVEAVLDASQLAVERAGRGTFVRVQGAPTLLRSLSEVLALDGPAATELSRVVIVADGAARRAFLVGAVGGAQTVVVHAAGRFLEGAPLVRSLVTTPDGRVAPLLAPGALLAAAARAPAASTAPHKRDATILVVDDSEIARQLVARHLVRAGFTVVEAMDGRAALLELSRRIPDAIVTDLQMPAMDGFQLLRAVRAAPTFSHVPVVVLSSLSADADKSRAGALGADAYIVKETLDAAALHETLARLIA